MARRSIPGIWKNIVGIEDELRKHGSDVDEIFVKVRKSSDNTFFWLDKWCGEGTLKEAFPKLYRPERFKHCKVVDKIHLGGLTWNWQRDIKQDEHHKALLTLSSRIGIFQPRTGEDCWKCSISEDDGYQACYHRRLIDSPRARDPCESVINWTHDVPIKVTCFLWRANLRRLPTTYALMKRGMTIRYSVCCFCGNEDEDVEHALWNYPAATIVWLWIFKWCDIPFLSYTE